MSSNDIAIRVSNLSKRYEIYGAPRDRLKQFILPRLQHLLGRTPKQYFNEFWALKEVSFEIKKGETVGIIGRNGSGKSTLLQMICGTLTPTSGSIQTNGRIAALLELGSGFNPEFTGRENVYMNASVLGLSKAEIDARFDDIVEFADIGQFIEQPVKTYSSGMYVRLAFAVIAHVDADILVVDEALSVGDAFFTQKCMRFIRKFQMNSGTLIFVSHDMPTIINICEIAIMLFADNLRQAIKGSAKEICNKYLNQIYEDPTRFESVKNQRSLNEQVFNIQKDRTQKILKGAALENNEYEISNFRKDAEQFGKGGVRIYDAGFFDEAGNRLTRITGGHEVSLIVKLHIHQTILYPAIGIMIKDRLGQYLYTEGTDKKFRHHHLDFKSEEKVKVIFKFTMPILILGQYTINLGVAEGEGHDHIQHHWIHDAIKIESTSSQVVHGISGLVNSEISIEFIA